jgi:hypothetical protein
MTTTKFALLPSNSSVSATVTLLVSAWFVVAAAAIVAEPSRNPAPQAVAATTPVTIAPQARLTITVEAPRLARS